LSGINNVPTGKLIADIGRSFLGTPYVAHTLEADGNEHLVVNLRELDCTTFLETSLALALTFKSGDTSFDNYCRVLQNIRYRNGILDGYLSRLHYFSDWIFDNESKKVISTISSIINGKKIVFNVNYMSTHPAMYKQLANDTGLVKGIRAAESAITKRTYYYIKKEDVAGKDDLIKEGDLIAITSNVNGLDINHVGIAVKGEGNSTYFLHASLNDGRVVVTDAPLSEYLARFKKHTGIIVVRAN
jgi:hypothetical protein